MRLQCASALLLMVACSGELAGGSDRTNGQQPGTTDGTGPGGGQGPGSDPADPRIAQRIWRLSPTQFNDEVKRVFGKGAPEVSIPESAAENGLTNIAANAVVDLGNASIFADGARAIGTWAAAQRGAVSRCTDHGTDACIDSFLGWCPQSAFRRPVSKAEVSELRTLFDGLRAQYDYDFAFAGIVRAILLSPDFLYRTELGDTGSALLAPQEIANLLAFSITEQSPDAELLAATSTADLTNPDERESQARRLMAGSERIWQRFFWEWLHMETLYSQGAEVGLDAKLVGQMEAEYRAFVSEVVVKEHGTLRDLLSAPYTFVEPELAAHYGAKHPGSGVARIELDPLQRGGLLTQGAWLVSHGKRGRDNVVRRGMGIFKAALCNDIRPPPNLDVVAELNKLVSPDSSVREIVTARGNAPVCGGCHKIADPVGMVFENYTSSGTWQATYPDGRAVDTMVKVMGVGDFDNAHAFSTALVDDPGFQQCFVRRFTHFLMGIDLGTPAMVAWTGQANASFVKSDTSLEELLVAIVRHPAFIERRKEIAP